MDYVFVLEDDPVYRKQITDTLKKIQETFEIKTFDSLDSFSSMVKSIMTHGPKALSSDDRETVRVVLVITRLEFIGADRLSLLEKTKEFFMRRGVCTAEEPTRFVLTAFDEPGFKFENLKRPIVANVIFKPFDRLILQQHLQLAMPQVKSGDDALVGQKASTLVEMLKSVEMDSMTELGFSSLSNRPFETGAVNKYYGKDFASDRQRSVMARLVSCVPVAGKKDSYQLNFQYFALDSTQVTNIRKKVRAKEKDGPKELKPPSLPVVPSSGLKANLTAPLRPCFVIIDAAEDEARSLAGTLSRKIANAEILTFKTKKDVEDDLNFATGAVAAVVSAPNVTIETNREMIVQKCIPDDAVIWGEPLLSTGLTKYFSKEDGQNLGLWLMGNKPEIRLKTQYNGKYGAIKFVRKDGKIQIVEMAQAEAQDFLRGFRKIKNPIDAVFVDSREIDIEHPALWEKLLAALVADQASKKPLIFMMANREFNDDEERILGKLVDDIFFQPLDRIYLLQKLLFDIPGLRILEDPVVVHEKKSPQIIRAANPVQLEEISEAILVINYYRTIEPLSFREFVLWQPYEISAPELCGVVHAIDSEGDDKNPAKIRFTFFGVRDHQLKAIRLWILNNYIHQKDNA